MREILFKAKRIDNGEWVEGFLFKTQENSYIAYNKQFDDDLFLSPQNIFIPIDKTTICQYTGLTDKNGNKIWENDVVKQYYEDWRTKLDYTAIEVIKWEQDGTRFVAYDKKKDASFWFSPFSVYEVIGNIFDNPELLQ